MSDREAMARAIALADLGVGRTAPNPPVGCVILDADRHLVGEGFHPRAGDPHAEVFALGQAGDRARDGTLYVTLEPCSHWGRTPPCADAIIRSGIRRVVAAVRDPDLRVSGEGLRRLRQAGIEVSLGFGAGPARRILEAYLKVKQTQRPFVLLKMAMTLDGKVATRTGDSRWVSSAESRSDVQVLRDRFDAVMVGAGTVRHDSPRLTVRPEELPADYPREGRNPARVVVDSQALISPSAPVVAGPGRVLLLTTSSASSDRVEKLQEAGVEVCTLEEESGRVPLAPALAWLTEQGLHSVLLEGGPTLAASALAAALVDRVIFFIAPKIGGGDRAPGPVGGPDLERMIDARPLGPLRTRRRGPDLVVEADVLERMP